MKQLPVNGYDMRYVEVGAGGPPLVLVHGSLSDYRVWSPVLGPLSVDRCVITPSLRHFFPEHWDGQGGNFTIPQHTTDLIAFIEALDVGPVDLCGHSRGGHIAFRLCEQRPDLVRRLILAEPGGTLDLSLAEPADEKSSSFARLYVDKASELIRSGDVEAGLRTFKDAIDGEGAWSSLTAADRQQRRDNAFTLIAQVNEQRRPYALAEALSISRPTLFVGGADTPGLLPKVLAALSKHVPDAKIEIIPDATHVMFVQQPTAFCDAVLAFLKDD